MSENYTNDSLNVLVIVALRIYDAIMLANAAQYPEATEALRQQHEAGKFVGDMPVLAEDPFGLGEQQVNEE